MADMNVAYERVKSKGSFDLTWNGRDEVGGYVNAGNALMKHLDHYRLAMVRQVKVSRTLTRISPTAVYSYACGAVVGTGLRRFERFWEQARRYQGDLLAFAREESPRYKEGLKMRFETIPKFQERLPSIGEGLSDALMDLLILALFNAVFFMGAVVSFLRYDVR
jgi:hypothetical protein